MALFVDKETENNTLKHLCRICKRGFGCGRALGGHMRAHGMGGEESSHHIDEDDEENEEEWENEPPASKRMYGLRTNPNNRLRSCQHCGKEFSSWKSFLEHGKCVTDEADSLVSSECGNWSKRKRSLRSKVGVASEEEDLANCLMMLSNASDAAAEESCASASRDDRINNTAHFNADNDNKAKGIAIATTTSNNNNKGLFECKACKKVFSSHQALGGHRASHKKVKGCFAARLDQPTLPSPAQEEISAEAISFQKRKSKVHECSICHRIFSSGQALGGHKRCHWITSNATAVGPNPEATAALAKFQDQINLAAAPIDLNLDLNLPADDAARVSTEIFLQPWIAGSSSGAKQEVERDRDSREVDNDGEDKHGNNAVIEDEADSKVKLAKLSELKDMNVSEGSSPWLQVGIGSTTDVGSTVP